MRWRDEPALTVVMATEGYPGAYERGSEIRGVDEAGSLAGVHVFHAGTRRDGGRLLADGGRVLDVTAIAAGEQTCFYIPGCAALTADVADRLRRASLVLFDGTLWRDDEMIVAGVGRKTGRRMGHISIAGDEGSLAGFAGLGVRRKIFVHINNTNPILLADSAERAVVERAGWEVAHDGMELVP